MGNYIYIPKMLIEKVKLTPRWVSGGNVSSSLGNNTMAYSDDGINWTGLGNSIFSTYCMDVCNNGYVWVACGQGTNTVAYSYDGINWTGINLFGETGNRVNWDGNKFWLSTGSSIYISTDGINWTLKTTGNPNFNSFYDVIWNGSIYVAGGVGTQCLAYSYDGNNWTTISGIFTQFCYSIAYNGTMWVACGQGTNTVAYSYDGINWTGMGTTLFSTVGYGALWSGTYWHIFGYHKTNKIYRSTDGISWTGMGKTIFSTDGYAGGYNGSLIVATGRTTNKLAYSSGGTSFTGIGNILYLRGYGIFSFPSPTSYPPIT